MASDHEITELAAVEQHIKSEFAKADIAVGDMVGLIVFKDCSALELEEARKSLPKEGPGMDSKENRELAHKFVMDLGNAIPFFMWDEQFLSVRFGASQRLDIGCPYFNEWLDAIIQHIIMHDDLKLFQFKPPA